MAISSLHSQLSEYIPLEQGLRPLWKSLYSISHSTQWVYSIRTRIKTDRRLSSLSELLTQWVYSIRTRIKTYGLLPFLTSSFPQWVYSIRTRIKTVLVYFVTYLKILSEYIPLEQGLRPRLNCSTVKVSKKTQWVYSIRTRIKTISTIKILSVHQLSVSIFH